MLTDGGLPRPGGPMDVKGAGDYVTAFDRQSEAAILEVLAREAPGMAVLAEERGGKRAGTMWAVDPLDGTTNFTRGFPVVAVSVGLLDEGTPIAGVVIAPFLGLEFAASQGRGATLNGDRLPRLPAVDPSKAIVATGFPFRNKGRMPRYRPTMEGAFRHFEDLRRAGAAALDLAWTAAGSFDGYFELNLNTWDLAAGAALVLEVGGRVSDWSGGPGWVESGDILAAPPTVHEVLLELAQESPDR
ncbi:MAG: inositol monophosphatase family protein [Candidatus Dormibacteraceae bacterium]